MDKIDHLGGELGWTLCKAASNLAESKKRKRRLISSLVFFHSLSLI
jgi:hypothetical protein